MRPDLRPFWLSGAIVIGAAFCLLAGLDFYITRDTTSRSLAAGRAARMALRGQFWERLRGNESDVELFNQLAQVRKISLADQREFYRILAHRCEAARPACAKALDERPTEPGAVYELSESEIAALKVRASQGNCWAAGRLASYNWYGALNPDEGLKWTRIAAKCPGAYYKELLVGMYVYHDVPPEYEGQIEELIEGIAVEDPALATAYRTRIKSGTSH